MTSLFAVEAAPDDPILSLTAAFLSDSGKVKVNLGVGAYQTSSGTPLVLTAVRKAESRIFEQGMNKEYPPLAGVPEFIDRYTQLILGADCSRLKDGCVGAIQTVGGTGALRVCADFLSTVSTQPMAISSPTWANHPDIVKAAGIPVLTYRYYDAKTYSLDFDGMMTDLSKLPAGSCVMLHAACHNPTGCDPTQEQWKQLSSLILKQRLVPLFDSAYQGFAQGVKEDVWAIRHFIEQGHELFIASSCAKNFGLYGERVGLLCVVSTNPDRARKILSQLKQAARRLYSMPPLHGARIVSSILGDQTLRQEWKTELGSMRERIQEMRTALAMNLMTTDGGRDFTFMIHENGLFSLLGLSPEQVSRLRTQFSVYMMNNSRINLAGLNPTNLRYVVESIQTVLKNA